MINRYKMKSGRDDDVRLMH